MAKLYAELQDERGIKVHKIGHKELCGTFFYGSRELPEIAAKVCLSVKPNEEGEKAALSVKIYRHNATPIYMHEEYPMPERRRVI